jgi:small subunit ribosomal protein S8
MSDPIGDMLNQIKQANHKFIETIDVPASKLKVEIAKALKEEGFIGSYKLNQEQRRGNLRMTLKFTPQKERVIQGIKRVSRPGLRIYRKYDEIPAIQNGLGVVILSTSKGILTGQKAREKKLGGEILCYVW